MKFNLRLAYASAALATTALALIAAEVRLGQPEGLTVHECGTFTSVAENGSVVPWIGSTSPAPVATSISPFGCSIVLMLTSCDRFAKAASRWFSRSAVLSPLAFNVTILSLRPPMVASVSFSVVTSETMLSCAVWRCVM